MNLFQIFVNKGWPSSNGKVVALQSGGHRFILKKQPLSKAKVKLHISDPSQDIQCGSLVHWVVLFYELVNIAL